MTLLQPSLWCPHRNAALCGSLGLWDCSSNCTAGDRNSVASLLWIIRELVLLYKQKYVLIHNLTVLDLRLWLGTFWRKQPKQILVPVRTLPVHHRLRNEQAGRSSGSPRVQAPWPRQSRSGRRALNHRPGWWSCLYWRTQIRCTHYRTDPVQV
jgi:hypothetical protein